MKCALVAALLLCAGVLPVDASDWGPWEIPTTRQQTSHRATGPLPQAVRFFQRHISPVDGPRCPMFPTCSAYSLQALRRHGPLLGVFLTVDRLYREGDPQEQQTPIIQYGYRRFFDPLHANDFWLEKIK